MTTKRIGALALLFMLLTGVSVGVAGENHVRVALESVGDSGVTGWVNLVGLPHEKGTHINVIVSGLEKGEEYVSLYYDNHECDLEPYSEDDVIGDTYTGNGGGHATTEGKADDDLDEINSVSVRLASDFTLLACADVHPES